MTIVRRGLCKELGIKWSKGSDLRASQNPLLQSDSYKLLHESLFGIKGRNLTKTYAWIAGRTGKDGTPFVVAIGQQHIANLIASFRVITEHVDEMEALTKAHIGEHVPFNRVAWDKIVEMGGQLPMTIKAVPEGTVVPRGCALMTVECTAVPELGPFLESHLQRIWAIASVATRAIEYRTVGYKHLSRTAESASATGLFPFYFHDFSVRACVTHEEAEIKGLAALAAGWLGTDNVPAIVYAQELMPDLDEKGKPKMPAFSVVAAEHNVGMSAGEGLEFEVFMRALETHPQGILSWMVDTYGTMNFLKKVLSPGPIRDAIIARWQKGVDKGYFAKLVLRPDSPVLGPDGQKLDHAHTCEAIFKCIEECLSDLTAKGEGIKVNSKGFKVLPPWLGSIYGDSVTPDDVDDILTVLTNAENMWCATNMIFGVGGNLIKVWRGWLDFAMKCSEQEYIVEETGEVLVLEVGKKAPGKVSPVGRQKVIIRDGRIQMVREDDGPEPCIMRTIYVDGDRYHLSSLQEVRDRVASFFGGWKFSDDPAEAAAALKAVEDPWTVGSSLGLESALKLPGNPFSAPEVDPLSDSAVKKALATIDPTVLAKLVVADVEAEEAEEFAKLDAEFLAVRDKFAKLGTRSKFVERMRRMRETFQASDHSWPTVAERVAEAQLMAATAKLQNARMVSRVLPASDLEFGCATPSLLSKAPAIAEAEECDARAQANLEEAKGSFEWAEHHLGFTRDKMEAAKTAADWARSGLVAAREFASRH
jgi:nicotinamide phosphoribosyltransferase